MLEDTEYKPLYIKARQLEQRLHDTLDNPHHPAAIELRGQTIQLQSDLELRRHPKQIEQHIKTMQDGLSRAKYLPKPFMNEAHLTEFHGHLANMRKDIRKFSAYDSD